MLTCCVGEGINAGQKNVPEKKAERFLVLEDISPLQETSRERSDVLVTSPPRRLFLLVLPAAIVFQKGNRVPSANFLPVINRMRGGKRDEFLRPHDSAMRQRSTATLPD